MYLCVAAEQGSQCSIDIKDANVAKLKAVADIAPVNRNLAAKNEAGIGTILGDGSDLQLGLHFAL